MVHKMQQNGKDLRNTHESLQKALWILLSFTPSNREKNVAGLCRELGFHKSTISRLLRVLVANGFLHKDPFTKKFSLGKSAFDLGNAIYHTIREKMVIIAQPYIDDLRDSIGLDVGLEVLLDNTTVYAYRTAGISLLRPRFSMGDRLPAHIVAGGKAMLAFSAADFVDRVLTEKLVSLTSKTVTDREIIRQRLAEYRKTGLAYDLGESDLDYHFVAAPVFDFAKRPVAAVVTGELAMNVQDGFDPKILSALKETAAKISARLMYSDEQKARPAEEAPPRPKARKARVICGPPAIGRVKAKQGKGRKGVRPAQRDGVHGQGKLTE